MGNYLKVVDTQRVLALLGLGWGHRRIQRETGVHRETVAKIDRERRSKPANLPADEMAPRPANLPTGPRSSAEPYRAVITAGVDRGLTAQRIWQDLCEEHAFAGSYDAVKRLARQHKRQWPEVADVLEHPPGEEAQVDYFDGPPTLDPATGRWRKAQVFRMTLCCSRHGYEEALWGQDREGFLRAHEHAFLEFGGVPRVIRHDNLKAAVVRACLYDPDVSVVYSAFGEHWGFMPLPSRPRHPQENGVEERSGGYVRSNALKGRRFADGLSGLNAHLRRWNKTWAQTRIHGTTRKQVLADFLERDKPALQPLPAERFALFEVGTRSVHNDGHVEVGGAFYSVPHQLVGRRVRVHWDTVMLRIYSGQELVAVHNRRSEPGWSTHPDHRPGHKPARREAYEATQLARCQRIGPRAHAWAQAAIAERAERSYRLLQGVTGLTRKHPRERVDWACGVALERRSFRYQTLRRLVEDAATEAAARPRLTQQHELIRTPAEYASIT